MPALTLPSDDPEVLLPFAEIAEARGTTVQSLHQMRHTGYPMPPTVKVGQKLYSRSSDVRRWILEGNAACASMVPFG